MTLTLSRNYTKIMRKSWSKSTKRLIANSYHRHILEWKKNKGLFNMKAILNKELSDMEKNTFAERVKKLIPHKKTLICDYFKK